MQLRSFLSTLLILAVLSVAAGVRAETLTVVCGAIADSFEPCRTESIAWAEAHGHEVRVLRYGSDANRNRDLVDQLLQIGNHDLDVIEVDTPWVSRLQPYLVDLKEPLGRDLSDHFSSAVLSFTRDREVFAVPWVMAVGRLFYRSDLLAERGLAVPRTWEDLASAARDVQDAQRAAGKSNFWGFLWYGKAEEGLTICAAEWIASKGVPPILAPDGSPTVTNPAVGVALSQATSWVGAISPPQVLDMDGPEGLSRFLAGEIGFLRYWSVAIPYATGTGSPLWQKVGVAPLPAGEGPTGRYAPVMGGYGLAVSRYSRHPNLAVDLVRWLTSVEMQKERALAGQGDPTRPDLYEDAELLKVRPDYPTLRMAFESAIQRPFQAAGRNYERISDEFSASVHRILERSVDPTSELMLLNDQLRRFGPATGDKGS